MGRQVLDADRATRVAVAGVTPRISVVIPTHNGMTTLPEVLTMLARQRIQCPYEIVAVDSSSTDGSAELLRSRVESVIQIRAETFNHGLARNLGIERSRGELVVLLVQDAVPASDTWLAALTAPMFENAVLAGTFGRQRPRDDASAVTRYYLERYLATGDAAVTSQIHSRDELDAMSPLDRLGRCTFDNVCSCVRRSIWRQHPFRETPIAEDVEWAREVLLAGYQLQYVPDACVVHSHDASIRYEFSRTRALHARLCELFGLRTIPSAAHLARAVAGSLALHARLQAAVPRRRQRMIDVGRALGLAIAWPLGQYLGARQVVRRRAVAPSQSQDIATGTSQ